MHISPLKIFTSQRFLAYSTPCHVPLNLTSKGFLLKLSSLIFSFKPFVTTIQIFEFVSSLVRLKKITIAICITTNQFYLVLYFCAITCHFSSHKSPQHFLIFAQRLVSTRPVIILATSIAILGLSGAAGPLAPYLYKYNCW